MMGLETFLLLSFHQTYKDNNAFFYLETTQIFASLVSPGNNLHKVIKAYYLISVGKTISRNYSLNPR